MTPNVGTIHGRSPGDGEAPGTLIDPRLSIRQVLEALQLAGVEPDNRPHHILFVISYSEEDLTRQAAEFLNRAHERAFGRHRPGGGTVRRIAERTWQLIIGAQMALEPEVFEPMETVARTLAEMFGGTYEGWCDETGLANKEAVQQALRLMATEEGKA